MRGHVRKRGSSWTVVYDEGQDERGKRRQRSKGGFATRREAQAFLTDVLSRLGDGSYAAPSKTTVGEYLGREWLPAVENTLRPLSYTKYNSVVRPRIVPHIGHLRLQSLSGGHLNGLYSELEQAGLSVSRDGSRTPCCTALSGTRSAGEARPQPRRYGRPAKPGTVTRSGVDGRRGRPFPRARARRPAVRTLAARGDHRDEKGRTRGRHLGVPSTSTVRASTSTSNCSPPVAASASDHRNRLARGGRSHLTLRRSTCCVPTAKRSCSSEHSPATPTRTATWCFATSSAAPSTPSG